jgi:hypothetical protein
MNMASVKSREAQVDSSWLTARIEDPEAMAVVCLRACRHREGIDHGDGLKSNEFSGDLD